MSLGSSLSCPLKFVLQLVHLSKFCKNCSGRILKKRAVGKHLVVLKMSSFQASFSHRKKNYMIMTRLKNFFWEEQWLTEVWLAGCTRSLLFVIPLVVAIAQFFISYVEQPPLSSFYLRYCCFFVIVIVVSTLFSPSLSLLKKFCSCSSSSNSHSTEKDVP